MAFEVGKPIVLEGRAGGKYIGKDEKRYYASSKILEINALKNENTLTVKGEKQAEILRGFIELKKSVIAEMAKFEEQIKKITKAAEGRELTDAEKTKLQAVLAEAEAYINETLGPIVGESLPKIADSLEPCIIANAEGNSIAAAHQRELASQQVLEMRQRIGDFLILFANESLRVGKRKPRVRDRLTPVAENGEDKCPLVSLLADNDRMIDVLEHEVNLERIFYENDIAQNNREIRELNRQLAAFDASRQVYELDLEASKSPEEMDEIGNELDEVVHKSANIFVQIQAREISNEQNVECINQANARFRKKVEEWKARKSKPQTPTEMGSEGEAQPS